jgi:hypothetical protein
LAGYYLASFLIDNKFYGRKMMQQVGFFMCFIMFIIPCFKLKYYESKEHIHEFQTMYFLSSFFNQFGPNSVTFLVAAEVFPVPIRASAHGFSAAVGKLGALVAAILINKLTTQKVFYVVPWFGLAGSLLTFFFLPDTTGLDLKEQERRWRYITSGREHEYHGIAIHPQHLSLWERMRGVGKNYNPELDYQHKVKEMRSDWEEFQVYKNSEEEKSGSTDSIDHLEHGELFHDNEHAESIHQYFSKSGSGKSASNLNLIAEEKNGLNEKAALKNGTDSD